MLHSRRQSRSSLECVCVCNLSSHLCLFICGPIVVVVVVSFVVFSASVVVVVVCGFFSASEPEHSFTWIIFKRLIQAARPLTELFRGARWVGGPNSWDSTRIALRLLGILRLCRPNCGRIVAGRRQFN